MEKTHYYTDENGAEQCLTPLPGCECMQCIHERRLAERGKTGENKTTSTDNDLFGVEEAKQRRKEQRRGDVWLERHGYL